MKKKIDKATAESMLLNFHDDALHDRIYGAVDDFIMENVGAIEDISEIIGEDGTPYTESDEVQWYDEIREECFNKCYESISQWLYKWYDIKPI